ncbi:MAG: type IV toxin-antitoxin system AbiEi family antitoxin [Actinobacteria bacterium]|jgi:predicted transcriptional regulator of viral defense system|nr:type IV toxin-antitoxin system AbiEi family antitoxin [Actinomycetota bacterium]MCL5444782.1 type IV toxin-antitoxin system AbiEi family antitoxin [Actinomycetota bacterium]
MPRTQTADAIDSLLAHGQSAVTTDQASKLLEVPAEQVRVRMHRMVRDGWVFSPARSLWVAIPPQYRTWRVIPGVEFIDLMMTHLGRDYYVGWLSAAELYGAAHQRPQVLQVAVDRHVLDRDIERVRLRFTERRHLAELPRVRQNVSTGQIWVSSPEVTALDLAADPRRGGGVNNVATVLIELTDDNRLDDSRLGKAANHFSLPSTRRLGYLLERIERPNLAEPLREISEQRRNFPPDLLSPGSGDHGDVDSRWRLRINTTVEPDL